MLGLIIKLICLAILAAISILCYFKNGKNFLNLVTAGFLIFAIIINCYSGVKKVNSAKTKAVQEIEKNIEEKESKLEILGINMECPKCEKLTSSRRNFCSDCRENLTEFNKMIDEAVSSR
jgi:uncharacterized membrane protein YbhN (UPF0104 family)